MEKLIENKQVNNIPISLCKPFLRWTGSKRWFVKNGLEKYMPDKFNNYHECFLGGGSVFFSIKPSNDTFLYDSNSELIETYKEIRDNVNLVIKRLKKFENTEDEYYRIRDSRFLKPHTRAARFIYLNRCSFNGIYRVNSKGIYNVPYGRRKNVDLVSKNNLLLVSESLKGSNIECGDFENSLDNIKKGDLVFLDPPYTVYHENNGFIEYNKKLFSWEDQERLKSFVLRIIEKGAFFILTNAYHKSIVELYKDCGISFKHSRYSQVGGRNKTRGMYNEIIICNTLI